MPDSLKALNIPQLSSDSYEIAVTTLGNFEVKLHETVLPPKAWSRDKTNQLFQFLIANRHRKALHKEQIIEGLWEGVGNETDFKVALHGLNKLLEPERLKGVEPKFIIREGLSYRLNQEHIWLDADVFDACIEYGNEELLQNTDKAILAYKQALRLYQGTFLPNRIYEDWSSTERERLQIMALNAHISLADLLVDQHPAEAIRLMENLLLIDNCWEEAYRLLMIAFWNKGNRPMAIKSYKKCQSVLKAEFDIEPLPETKNIYQKIIAG